MVQNAMRQKLLLQQQQQQQLLLQQQQLLQKDPTSDRRTTSFLPSSQFSNNLIVDVEDKNMMSKEELEKLLRFQNFQKLKQQQQQMKLEIENQKFQRPRMNEEESPNEDLSKVKEETKKVESSEGKKVKLRKMIKKQIHPIAAESSNQSKQDEKS